MQRWNFAKIIVLLAIFGFFIAYVGVPNIAYALIPHNTALDIALGRLARAESAQTPDELIHHVTIAKDVLPERVDVFWGVSRKSQF